MAGAGLIRRIDALERHAPDIDREWNAVLDRLSSDELERLEYIVTRLNEGEALEAMTAEDRALAEKVERMEV